MLKSDPIETVLKYVKRNGKIANRDCRQILGISYDETIFLLGGMCKSGLLERQGASSGTHYVLGREAIDSAVVRESRGRLLKSLARRSGAVGIDADSVTPPKTLKKAKAK